MRLRAAVRDDDTSAKGKRQLMVGVYDRSNSEKQPLQFVVRQRSAFVKGNDANADVTLFSMVAPRRSRK